MSTTLRARKPCLFTLILCVCLLVAGFVPSRSVAAPLDLIYKLAVYYVLPADVSFDAAVLAELKDASLDIQSWYQVATGGLTWEWAFPDIARVYEGRDSRAHYVENGNWWGSLLPEMGDAGLPIWEPGIVTALWAQGAGWWAGGAQGCEGDCGVVLLGVELFPQFNNPAWSGGTCPDSTGRGGDAWPCTPEGAYAHELGHTLGLPHPYDDPVTAPYAFHSLMQTHWNYPDEARGDESPWGFLSSERQRIRGNPFMKVGLSLAQRYESLDIVVNLPPAGAPPFASFEFEVRDNMVTFVDLSQGEDLHYWVFGDAAVSNAASPTHRYREAGTYGVRLWVSNAQGLLSMSQRSVQINVVPAKVFLPTLWSGPP